MILERGANTMLNILISNDDGIYAPGIIKLAEAAKSFGDVTVVAPAGQRSAAAHGITIRAGIRIKKVDDFPVPQVKAYSISGTPADCIKIANAYLLEQKPDIVFSGINNGYNAGTDISYSGTVAVALEATLKNIPAIAFSTCMNDDYIELDKYLHEIIEKLIGQDAGEGKAWNVNFPGCIQGECKGILWDRVVATNELYLDNYNILEKHEDGETVVLEGIRETEFAPDTDHYALINGYISVGKVTNLVAKIL